MSKQRIFLIAAAALTLLLVLGMGLFMQGQEEYVPPNQVSQIDTERSQVYLTGTGYKVDKEQEQTHKKQEKEREKKQQANKQSPKNNPAAKPAVSDNKNDPSQKPPDNVKVKEDGDDDDEDGKPEADDPDDLPDHSDDESTEEDRAKRPRITISVSNGETVQGKRLDFTVTAKDYKGRNIPVFSEDDGSFTVVCNGKTLSSDGDGGFRTELKDGRNTIKVIAWDREGNKNTKTVSFRGDTTTEAEVIGQVHVSVAAPILHLGTLAEATVSITSGDTAKDVLDETFKNAGISPTYKGTYLAGLSRSGISSGASIDDSVREEMEERRQTEKDPSKQDTNKLKEHDFYDSSGWVYQVNGVFPMKGLGAYKMEDGDSLYLVFQLAEGIY